jgi:hypothetical protein
MYQEFPAVTVLLGIKPALLDAGDLRQDKSQKGTMGFSNSHIITDRDGS